MAEICSYKAFLPLLIDTFINVVFRVLVKLDQVKQLILERSAAAPS